MASVGTKSPYFGFFGAVVVWRLAISSPIVACHYV
jgi:hypothetical protein